MILKPHYRFCWLRQLPVFVGYRWYPFSQGIASRKLSFVLRAC